MKKLFSLFGILALSFSAHAHYASYEEALEGLDRLAVEEFSRACSPVDSYHRRSFLEDQGSAVVYYYLMEQGGVEGAVYIHSELPGPGGYEAAVWNVDCH